MRRNEEYRRAERIKGWTPMLAERFSNDRLNDEEQALRKYYRTEQTEATLDTRENRFVKYTLQRITERLSLLMKRLGDGTSDSEIDNLKDKQKELEMLRRNSFFNSIGYFDGFRQQSMVLQQRSGYSQVYRYWIMLQNGLDLIQGDTSVGVQPIWRLYELWCFLKVKQLVCKVLGIDVHNKEHLEQYVHEDTQNAFDLFNGGTLSGHITYTNPQNGDLVEVGYQYSFDRKGDEHEMRSATTEQRPDIVMHIHKKDRNITLTYLYDAKYSVRGDDDATLGIVQDEPKPETINAMHHYRDAIYYGKRGEHRFSKEIIGGYILFPGRMDEQRLLEQMQHHDEQLPYFLKSIEEVNIGAYPLLPDEESGLLLENHLRKVLLGESIIEQLEVSVPQRGLYYTDTQPKSVESKNVFTVTVRKTDADYQTFFEHKARKYVMETLPKVNILEAVYLLPMVGGDIDGYYKITRLTIEDGKMCLKLGEFISLGNQWVNIFQNMRHGELITMNNVLKLYGQRY